MQLTLVRAVPDVGSSTREGTGRPVIVPSRLALWRAILGTARGLRVVPEAGPRKSQLQSQIPILLATQGHRKGRVKPQFSEGDHALQRVYDVRFMLIEHTPH